MIIRDRIEKKVDRKYFEKLGSTLISKRGEREEEGGSGERKKKELSTVCVAGGRPFLPGRGKEGIGKGESFETTESRWGEW